MPPQIQQITALNVIPSAREKHYAYTFSYIDKESNILFKVLLMTLIWSDIVFIHTAVIALFLPLQEIGNRGKSD